MEERLGRNIIHKSRSMAACPGLEQPEGLGRGTLGGITRAGVEYCQQFNSSMECAELDTACLVTT